MGSLILHIGMPKAGSTALQLFFDSNKGLFPKQDTFYPDFTPQAEGSPVANGTFLRWYAHSLVAPLPRKDLEPRNVRRNLDLLRAAFEKHGRVLISSEDFFLAPTRIRGIEAARARYWQALAELLGDAGADQVRVIAYLRRQDDYIASRWKQDVGIGLTSLSFDGYRTDASVLSVLDYAGLLEDISRAFPNAELVVRRYDRAAFAGGDIFHDFCDAAGMAWDPGFSCPSFDVNPSISFDAAEALRRFALKERTTNGIRTDALIELARRVSAQHPDPKGMTPFSEEDARAFMAPYLEGNRLIAERFLEGGPLFPEDFGGRPQWIPDEDRIAEGIAYYRRHFSPLIAKHMLRRLRHFLVTSIRR